MYMGYPTHNITSKRRICNHQVVALIHFRTLAFLCFLISWTRKLFRCFSQFFPSVVVVVSYHKIEILNLILRWPTTNLISNWDAHKCPTPHLARFGFIFSIDYLHRAIAAVSVNRTPQQIAHLELRHVGTNWRFILTLSVQVRSMGLLQSVPVPFVWPCAFVSFAIEYVRRTHGFTRVHVHDP